MNDQFFEYSALSPSLRKKSVKSRNVNVVQSLAWDKKKKKRVYQATQEMFLERFPRTRFEMEWNTDKCSSSILHPNNLL